MYIRKIEIALIILVCLITSSIMSFSIKEACYTKVQASSLFKGAGQTKVVMITMDYIDLQDIAEDKYLSMLFNNSFSALVSNRQIGKASAAKAKLSIGAGKRLMLKSAIVQGINYSSQLEYFYQTRLEGNPGNVLYQNIKDLKNENKNSEYASYIGYLGDRLNELGKTTCVIGNSDTDVNNRNNVLIAMDGEGNIDLGDVENAILYDESFPGGKRTDFTKLAELYKLHLPASDFLVIDTGDLARLEYYRSQVAEEDYEIIKKQTIARISQFVEQIIKEGNTNTTFILISAYPTSKSIKLGYKLTPIISYTYNHGGFLYSKSTKRDGIITSLDIADYIVEKISAGDKSQLQEINTENSLKKMLMLKRRLLNISVMRLPVLTWYAVFEIICGVLGLLYMLNMKLLKSKTIGRLIKTTLLVNISAPVVLLYMAVLNIDNAFQYFAVFVIVSLIIVYILNKIFKDTISRFVAAALLANASITIDLLRGSTLIKNSVFGYDPIIGARFYGIGNEFAGVFIGSSILLAGCLLHKFKDYVKRKPVTANILLLFYFAAQLYIIGMPTKGANFGATIAAVCGFYFFFCAVRGKTVKLKQVIFLGFIVVLVVTLIILIDLINSDNTTHVGRFIKDIKENGFDVLFSTFARKLEMNIRLMKYTIWTKVLLCIILIITIMFFKPVRLLHSIFKKYSNLASAWLGISAASIAGLIVNDSGIVMAATAMIFTGYTILYICLEEMET